MATPFPGIKVKFIVDPFNIKTTDLNQENIKSYTNNKNVTNYEYELGKNEDKRKILILKPEYLSAFLSDMKNMMKYGNSSQYIDNTTKRAYNPKLKGV